ncbi:twin-arginine translocase TatA/TatE family subunit [Idiomarina tyrosinivorans]|uniref:Sec-independent protein translocase protein TatA n=1 Tax=Idiomarina tyrosinivorans TaxID=1445662 RepID=A0A432ZQ21_9GAMM|nr:twin-arginine translocase TatA/TatE family subunit [Idiomarina tyrosinivorans]RUO80004.1 twin-arginine translocase TatA/TatE family subunit [Idiomarina tyrosinivorans]
MGISIWQLLILLLIVVLLFGSKRLSGLGSDLGNAIKGFKKSVKSDDDSASEQDQTASLDNDKKGKDGDDQPR